MEPRYEPCGPSPSSTPSAKFLAYALLAGMVLVPIALARSVRRNGVRLDAVWVLLGACQAPRDPRAPLAVEQRAPGQLELRPQIMQVPLQRVVERAARADEALHLKIQRLAIRDVPQAGGDAPAEIVPRLLGGDGGRLAQRPDQGSVESKRSPANPG